MSTLSAVETLPVETSTKPVKVFRDRNISVTIFRNSAMVRDQERVFHNAYIERTYKDGEEFKTISSFGKDDLPRVQLLVNQAWNWCVEQETAARAKVSK